MSMTNILKRLFQDDGSGQMLRPEIVPGNKPIGEIFFYAGTDIPSGALRLDGQSIVGVSAAFPDFKAWVVEHAVLCTLDEYETELATYEGQCGKFGWDASSDTLRLPTVTGFIGAAASTDEIGKVELAGLPNIVGTFAGLDGYGPSGPFSIKESNVHFATDAVGTRTYYDFNASLVSPIFGRSSSVTPANVRYPFFIQVYNSAVGVSEAQAAEFAGLVDGLRQDVPGMAASAAGPSEKYIDFSLPEKEGSYPAPADGWIALMAKPSGTNAVLQTLVYPPDTVPDGSSYIWRDEYVSVNATQYAYLKTRVSKGQVVQLNWGSIESFTYSRFIYANGNGNAPE